MRSSHAIFTRRSDYVLILRGMRGFWGLLLAALAASPAAAQPAPALSADDAMVQDAAEYARIHHVPSEEALRRMRAQADSVVETEAIRTRFAGRVAGIAIRHTPDFAIEVLLTGSEAVPDGAIVAGGGPVPVRYRTGALATREELVAALRDRRDDLDAAIGHAGIGVDQRTGELVVLADSGALGGASAGAMSARLSGIAGVPVRVRILGGTNADSGIPGGGRVEGSEPGDSRRFFCTTGFVVTDGARMGIVTAAHCPDTMSYKDSDGVEVPLDYVGGWGAQSQDVQVHVGAVDPLPVFRGGGSGDRPLAGRRLRAATRAGETVCHRGEASGYSCAEVELTDFAPPGTLCGGQCLPTWVTVAGPSCRGGDSGGPVFAGTTAFGIVKGSNYASDGRCNFYFYMSTDFLPTGWSLLVADASGAVRPD